MGEASNAALWRRLEGAEAEKAAVDGRVQALERALGEAEARAAAGEAAGATLWRRLEGAHREMAGLVEGRAALEARVAGLEAEVRWLVVRSR